MKKIIGIGMLMMGLLFVMVFFCGCGKKEISPASNVQVSPQPVQQAPAKIKERVEILYYFVSKFGEDVRTIWKKYISKYDDKGNMIERTEYNTEGAIKGKVVSKYDDKGYKIEEATYNEYGNLEVQDIYKNDDKGNMIEQTQYRSPKANGASERKYAYRYEYNAKGEIIEITENNAIDGTLYHKTIQKYDDKSNKIEAIMYNKYGGEDFKWNYKYNDTGKLIEKASKGGSSYKNTYKYDDKGNMIEDAYCSEKGTDKVITISTYTYN